MRAHQERLKEGTVLNRRYRIETLLGSREAGCVYACRDLSGNLSKLVIRMLAPVGAGKGDGLQRELSMLVRLQHPGLARVTDFGIAEGSGALFLVEEHVEGADIHAATEGVALEKVLGRIVDLAAALHHLHARGILHGDLRSSNVRLAGDGEEGRPIVLGYGLRRFLPENGLSRSLSYAAPETLLGGEATARSDLYSLGILIYRTICRCFPFEDDDAGFLVQKQLQARVDLRPVERLGWGSALAPLLGRMLEKDPENREVTAEEAATAIWELIRGDAPVREPEFRFSAAPFVGRENEMLRVQARARGVKESGRGWTLFLSGEAGAGKTRFMEELRNWARLEGWHVAEGTCGVREELAYAPYRQILLHLDPRREGAPSLFEHAVRSGQSDPSEGSSGFATGQFQDHLTRELVRRLADAPTLLFLHDFHNADRSNCAVLDYLSADIQAYPVLACVSLRSGEEFRGNLDEVMESAARSEKGEVVALEPLSKDSLRRMAEGMMGAGELPAALNDWLYRAVGGNPFFLEQMLKHLLEQGALSRKSGIWRFFDGDANGLEVPAEVGSVLLQRLQYLPSPARSLANWLALYHRPASTETLGLAMSWSAPRVAEAVAELKRRQMVRVESAGDEETVDFSHELISEIVRQNLPKGAAPRMHRKIAEGILREHGPAGRLNELALHYVEGRSGVSSMRCVLASAAQSRAEFAHENALRCFDHVFGRLNGLTDEETCRAAIDASDTMFALGLAERALRLLKQVLGRHRSIGEELRARMYMQLALACQHIGDVRLQEAYCRKGLAIFNDHPVPDPNLTKAMLWAELAFIAVLQSRPRKGLSCLDKALKACPEENATALKGRIQNLYASLYRVACDLRHALKASQIAVNVLSNSEEAHLACSAYSTLGFILMGLGRLPLSLENHIHAAVLAEKCRSLALKSQALTNLTECLCRLGRIQDAINESMRASKLIEDSKIPAIRNAFNAILAEVRFSAGNYREARRLISEICQSGSQNPSPFTVGHAHYVAAELSYYLGNFPETLQHIKELSRHGRAEAPLYEHELAEALKARILSEQGQGKEAQEKLKSLDRAVTRKHWPYQMCIIRMHIGEVLCQQGKPKDAERYARNALRLAQAMQARPLAERAHLLLGLIYSPSHGRSGDTVTNGARAFEHLRLCAANASSFLHLESLWRAHAELSLLYGIEGEPERSFEAAEKAYEYLCKLEDQLPLDALASFYSVFDRSRLKLELLRIIERGRTQRPSHGRHEATHPADRNARTLHRLSTAIASAQDMDALLEDLLDQLIPAIGVDRAFIFLRKDTGGELLLAKGRMAGGRNLDSAGSIHWDILEDVFRVKSPLISANSGKDPRIKTHPATWKGGGRLMCAPLKASGRVIGVLYADHAAPSDSVAEPVISVFAAACSLTALAIANLLGRPHPPAGNLPGTGGISAGNDLYPEIVGESSAIHALKEEIRFAAASPLDVLIRGESGTGKELVARAIYRTDRRKSGKLISVDCGTLSDTLAESELFGYRKGAFTGALEDRSGLFEAADGGILFLDEIANMPLRLQAKFLRVLQEREVRRIGEMHSRKVVIRVIAASNKDLMEEVRFGRFREDLLYRVRVSEIRIPPLRERREDIPLLIEWFLQCVSQEGGVSKRFLPEAFDLLLHYSYPGNARELRSIVQRACYAGSASTIDVKALPPEVRCGNFSDTDAESVSAEKLYRAILSGKGEFDELVKEPLLGHHLGAQVVRDIIGKALQDALGNYTKALRLLRIPERRYTSTLQFLKRRGCYVDYRSFRSRRGEDGLDSD